MASPQLEKEYKALLKKHELVILPHAAPDQVDEYRAALLASGHSEEEVEGLIDTLSGDQPGFARMLQELAQEVESDIRAHGATLDEEVFTGEFPTGSLNARIMTCEHGCLVLFNTGLMITTFLILKTMARSFVFSTDGQPPQDIPTTQTVVNELLPILHHYHKGDARLAPRIERTVGNQLVILMRLLWATEKFVMAHEYAHLLCGHVGNAVQHEALHTNTGTIEVVSLSHKKELDADVAALALLMETANWSENASDAQIRIAGPFIFFAIHDMLTRVGEALYDKPAGYSSSHPTTALRIETLRTYVFSKYGEELFKYADLFGAWLRNYTNFIISASQEGHIFQPDFYVDMYRRIIEYRNTATNEEDRTRAELDAKRLREIWTAAKGEDSLHEVVFGGQESEHSNHV